MEEKLLQIIHNYGVLSQLKYFQSEVFELNEAIITHELKTSVEYEIPLTEIIGTKEHMIEELADVMVLLCQFKEYYHIDGKDILRIMNEKIERQLERIKNENNK